MGDNYKNQPEQPKATPLWTAEKQIMESVDIEKTVVVNNKPAKQSKSYGKNQKPKKPFNKLWLVIPLCLALVAGTVLCGYLAFFNSKGDDDTEESSAVTDSSADSSEVLESKGFNWMLENGVLTITGIGPMPNFTVESPAPWMTAGEITAVVISNSITSIGDFAFYECEDVTSVTIPGTVITIGKGAFEDCNSLESITVPEGVTSIDDGAFAGSGLTSVTIPSTVTDMGSDLFNHCAELISIVYNGTKEQWDAIEKDDTWQGNAPIKTVHCNDTAFDPQNPDAVLEYDAEGTTDKGLTWTLLDGTLTISGEGEMDDFEANEEEEDIIIKYWQNHRDEIKTVVISDGVTSVGYLAFVFCDSLTSVSIPGSVTRIKKGAFGDCKRLTSVTLGEGVTSIDDSAFPGCAALESITIPDSVTNIGHSAFSLCTALASVNYNGTKAQWNNISLGNGWNYNCPFTVVHCTNGDVDLNGGVADITYDKQGSSGDISWTLKDGVFTVSGKGNMPVSDIAAFDISVWIDCKSDIEIVKIENGVTDIGDTSFAFCSKLKTVSIPNSVTSIGDRAFEDCDALKSISIPNSVTSIGNGAFYSCNSLTSISIPDSVAYIGYWAFEDCDALKSISIPDSITCIGDWAFYSCDSLTSVNYSGTMAQWEKISFGNSWKSGSPFTVVHCTDGDVAVG